MMFSEKQYIFVMFLMKKLGFTDFSLIEIYLNKLLLTHRNKSSICIDVLLEEIEIKKKPGLITHRDIDFNSNISATDLSNFNFCSASYSIFKTYDIKYPTNEDKLTIGTELHESLRLISKPIPYGFSEIELKSYKVIENEFIKRIKNSTLIFSGHTDEKKFFINNKLKYIGQPDYIFKDEKGSYFVVEEKFRYLNSYIDQINYEREKKQKDIIKNTIFNNHIIQIKSYMDFIEEYKIDYGVLIYWFYDSSGDIPYVHDVSTKVINKNEYIELLNDTYNKLNHFLTGKIINFNKNVNPNKCISCSVSKYCAHKTGNFENIKIPYNKADLRLKYIDFPSELIKEKLSDEDT